MNLTPFTRRLEECRRRWHLNSVRFVLGVARIVRAARRAAKSERRWGEWIRNETHMNRTTVYRYLRVAEFLRSNVSLKKHLVSLSIVKLYYLSRLKREQALELIKSGKAEMLHDVAFIRLARRLMPRVMTRAILPNLAKSTHAALGRLERSLGRWQHSELVMPLALQLKLQSRLQALSRTLERIRRASAAAM